MMFAALSHTQGNGVQSPSPSAFVDVDSAAMNDQPQPESAHWYRCLTWSGCPIRMMVPSWGEAIGPPHSEHDRGELMWPGIR